jgi:hypothetical protein
VRVAIAEERRITESAHVEDPTSKRPSAAIDIRQQGRETGFALI